MVHFSRKISQLTGGNNFSDLSDNELTKFRAVFHPAGSELDMDWIHPLIALGWPGLGEISGN